MSKVPEMFGSLVFNDSVMQEKLPKDTYKALKKTREQSKPLDLHVANIVANAMKNWAVEKGATHFTHWFQPMTGITAEKHDSFIYPVGNGKVIMEFSGKELIKGEPDASSFPSGGLRATFEARGYTAWDPTSDAFIKDGSLCIPTAFCSYGGEALDKKTPLLRSMNAINKQAMRILKLFGTTAHRVITTVGAEQEYFLIDKDMYAKRKDLIYTGRTLFGAKPPKGQELEDHYFGVIKPRVSSYMKDLDEELWKLGILAKTKHNEVAPAQHELAPIFTTANVATDQNQLTMEIMKKVATKHNLYCLLHEKPFKGVNGSGKHNNWSITTDTGVNLLEPGDSPRENAQFLLFLTAIIKAVDEHQDLLRISVASAGNDHRLGADEAPPAIVSMFIGEDLASVLKSIEDNSDYQKKDKSVMKIGLDVLPSFTKDTTDRNRTSPFAFTGNRFEFRAVGASANCSSAMSTLNAVVASQLIEFKREIDKKMSDGMKKEQAIFDTLRLYIKECKSIRFDGNGYSDEWKEEAEKRGLDCETSVPVIYDAYLSEKTVKMYESTGVLNERELHARNEVKWETYTKKIQIEARVLGDLSMNHIIPVATQYQSMLLDNLYKMRVVFDAEKAEKLSVEDAALIEEIATHISAIKTNVDNMVDARKSANKLEDAREKAIAYHDKVEPFLSVIRYHIDKLELIVDNQMWPLPKYRELLFIS